MSHKTEFPNVQVPAQFHSYMFDDISLANNCECPTFILRDSVLDDHHYITVLVDSIGVRFRAIRKTAYFESELIFEADTIRGFFLLLLKSIEIEKRILTRIQKVFYLDDTCGLLSTLDKTESIQRLRIIGFKRIFFSLTSCGFLELRELKNSGSVEVDRKFRNDLLLENLENIESCLDCEKFYFKNGEKCKC